MRTLRKRLTATAAIVIALAITPALSGCFGGGNPVEGIIEGVTGGNVDLGGQGLPEGFPTSEVPVYQGDVIYGIALGDDTGKVYNITVRVPSKDAVAEIIAQFEAAGYTAQPVTDAADTATVGFQGDKWGVLVVVTKDDTGFVANYSVTPIGQ